MRRAVWPAIGIAVAIGCLAGRSERPLITPSLDPARTAPAGEQSAKRRKLPAPPDALVVGSTNPVSPPPRAFIDAAAPRQELEDGACALLEGRTPPGDLAEESYDPLLDTRPGRTRYATRARPPQVRMGATSVTGKLPPEVIQRIVRQNFGRLRLCYDNGLRSRPTLQGKVVVRFVIGKDGSVLQSASHGSDLPDASVVACVVRAFSGLSFPQPESPIVTVIYPVVFSPGD